MLLTLSFFVHVLPNMVQGDILCDREISSLEYNHADIQEVLRALFRDFNADYVVESGVSGSVKLSLRRVTLDQARRKILDQVRCSSSYVNGVYWVENQPNLPEYSDILNRKLPAYDFTKSSVPEALNTVFTDARVRFRHSPLAAVNVGRFLPSQTLAKHLDALLPLANCRLEYSHGRFDFIANSTELIPGGLLDKKVAAIDFLDVSARDAFNTLFSQSGIQFVLGPDIDSRITMKLHSRRFEDALNIICQATDTSYRWRGDIVQISRRSL